MYIIVIIFIYFKFVSFWKNDRGLVFFNGFVEV